MAGMHHALVLASRILAALLAAAAFYFAFFLYEDEEGVWQNRIENLWASIHDRAKVTDTTSTAVLNKIGELFKRFFASLYGKKLLSFRAVVVSIDLSLAGAFFLPMLLFLGALVAIRSDRTVTAVLRFCWSLGGFCVSLACTICPIFWKKVWASAIAFLPTGVIFGLVAYLAVNRLSTLGEVLGILVVSTACDFLSVLALRRFAEAVTNTLSLARILLEIITLAAIILLIFGLPWETQVHYTHLQEFTANQKYEAPAGAAAMLLLMNITTVVLCMLPIFVLIFLLLHRLFWPSLSRLLYPVASRRIVTNHKALISIGSASLLYAANIPQEGFKGVLKLLS